MDAVRGLFARNTTPNSAPHINESYLIIGAQRKRSDHPMTSDNVPPREAGVIILRRSWVREDLLGGGLWPC